MTPATAQPLGRGQVTTMEGRPIPDVAVTLKGRPTYISDVNGNLWFAIDDGQYIVERIEKPGYRLVSPRMPFVQTDGSALLKVVMEVAESNEQRAVREKGASLYERVLECEQKRLYGDGADLMIERANLDTMNVRWQFQTGDYMHKYGDYATAQKFYNRAIHKAQELYGDKNQYLAICYQLYGDNYYTWRVWGENSVLNYADAKTYYRQAGHYWYSLLGENNNQTALIYNKMGSCWFKLDNLPNAAECFSKALEVLLAISDADRGLLASTYGNLAVVAINNGEWTKALEWYTKDMEYLESLGVRGELYQYVQNQIELLKKKIELAEGK